MTNNEFVHLHVHSDFSLCNSTAKVEALVDRAEELGMKYLALTDHGNMFGIMEFISACTKNSDGEGSPSTDGDPQKRLPLVKPIIGCEVYVSPGSRFEKKGTENENKYYHLILLAANREGYSNLVKLCSFAYTEGFYYRPRIDGELLAKYRGGLIALSACVSGEIPRLIRAGKTDEAEKKALHYRDLFGKDKEGKPNFYLEIQNHGIPAEVLRCPLSQKDVNGEIAAISRRTGIPLVATNDVHYLDRGDYVAHDVLLCIGTAKLRTEEKRKKYHGDQFYFKTGDEMAALFPEYPEAIANTVRIAERCTADFMHLNKKTDDLSWYLPEFSIPPGFGDAGVSSGAGIFSEADAYLRHLSMNGLTERYANEKETGGSVWQKIYDRAEYELGVIIDMGFSGYFLIVADIVNWVKKHGIPVGPGRGSSAGSIVAYALRITDIDPLKYGLLFERFLNPERISMPDFAIDFGEGRDKVIRHVTEKYGKDRVGQIIIFATLGARAVIKDVARTLGISINESDHIAKLIPGVPGDTLKKAFEEEPKLREMEKDPKYTELFALARKLEGLKRHSSIHPAALVIGKSVLHDFVPLYRDAKTGTIVTQYDKNHLEKCGLMKMDFLGLKTLDVIRHTEEIIRRRGDEYAGFNIEIIPEDDRATFKMLGEGKSFAIFLFESDRMQSILKQAKPDKIEDLIVLNALYRSGPIKFIPRFADFNKSHAAAYSVIAYRTAYLKANFPAEFMAANLTNEIRMTDKYRLSKCIDEARKMGLAINPPDINRSDKFFTVADEHIVYGLLGIKGMGDAPAEEIVRCRNIENYGLYKNFMDFLDRVDIRLIGKSVIEKLIQTGAFDSFGVSRENLHGNLDRAVEYAQKRKDDKQYGQTGLFNDMGKKEYADFIFENFPELSRTEKLNFEKQLIGFYFSGNPLEGKVSVSGT